MLLLMDYSNTIIFIKGALNYGILKMQNVICLQKSTKDPQNQPH